MIDAIILAGDEKGLNKFNNKTMIEYIIDVFLKIDTIDKIVVVGAKDKYDFIKDKVYKLENSESTMLENIKKGLNSIELDKPFIISSSDIPFITTEAVCELIEKSINFNAEFAYPLINKNLILNKFPEMKRSYFKLKEGVFTGGNICFATASSIEKGLPYLEQLYKYRKNKLMITKIFSTSFIIGILLGILPLKKIEEKFYRVTNIKAYGIITEYAEIGCDIDKPQDIEVANKYFNTNIGS